MASRSWTSKIIASLLALAACEPAPDTFDTRHGSLAAGVLVYRLPYLVNVLPDGSRVYAGAFEGQTISIYPVGIDHGRTIYDSWTTP